MTRHLYLARHGEADGDLTENGRRQANLLAERLKTLPLQAIHHSPAPRATQTARLIATHLPDIPLHESELLGDYPPYLPTDGELPPRFAAAAHAHINHFPEPDLTNGPWLARRAIERFTGPVEPDRHELIVTHNQIVCWFARDALAAPNWRWLGLNAANAALTIITYRPGRPPELVTFNDLAHLPAELRWTGFPSGAESNVT